MKVSELRDFLARYNPSAEVYLVTQERGPHESLIAGIATREEVVAREKAAEVKDPDDGYSHGRWTVTDRELPQDDVFIVEGRHMRFATWEALWAAVSKR